MRRQPDSERLYELVGKKVEQQRRKTKLTQTQLALRCGLARGSVANIESGNQRATLHTLWSIAEALGIDMRSLLPSQDEYLGRDQYPSIPEITSKLKKVAGKSQSHVASFIASSREEVNSDEDKHREKG